MLREPYSKSEVIDVVERRLKGPVPLAWHKWWGEGLRERYNGELDRIGSDIPDDVILAEYIVPGDWESPTVDSNYRWAFSGSGCGVHKAVDSNCWLDSWDNLDQYIEEFPDPDRQPGIFQTVREKVTAHPDRYVLGVLWQGFYERAWFIRGMENLLMDFLLNPEEVLRLFKAILGYHKKVISHMASAGVDGVLITDDLGSQSSLVMSPFTFRDLLKPFYKELAAEAHRHGLHFWLHSCGNIMAIIEDLIESGVDVLHPLQAGTMNYDEVVEHFSGRVSFLVGFDVQHLLTEGTEEEVRAGVQRLVDKFRPYGGFLLGAGNGILPNTPLRNIRAFLEEAALIKP